MKLVSRTTYFVCVKIIRGWHDLQLEVDSKRQIFEKLFMPILFYSLNFCQKEVVVMVSCGLNCSLISSKLARYLLDYLFIFNIHTAQNSKTNGLLVFLTYKTKTADWERNKT